MPVASVVIPARNAEATIGATLAALASQDLDGDIEVIVVDDGSTDGTAQAIAGAPLGVRVIRADGAGPGPARNLGSAAARADVLAFTDADCIPEPGWLRAGVEALASADLVQGSVRPDAETVRLPFDRTVWVTGERGLYESASLFVRRELFERLRGFEDWLPASIGKPLAEDVWLGWRARRAGARVAFAESAAVRHAVFRQRPSAYVAERLRRTYFPPIVRQVPELREAFLYRRWFLDRNSAAFDLAAVGALGAAVTRSRAPLAMIAPYAVTLAARSLRWRRRAPLVAPVELAADAVGFAALAWGSLRSRAFVL